MWFGESEANVRDVFDKARAASPCGPCEGCETGPGEGDELFEARVVCAAPAPARKEPLQTKLLEASFK